jgi:hypothetical protein
LAGNAGKGALDRPFSGRMRRAWNQSSSRWLSGRPSKWRTLMGRYMLLWLLGVPIPILILIWAFGGLH